MEYRLNKGDIQLPTNWTDETLYIFKAPEEDGYNIVINQNPVPHGLSSHAFLYEQYAVLQENLTEYHETNKTKPDAEKEQQIIEYDWSSPEGKVYQINMMLITEKTLLSFTATSTKAFSAAQKQVIYSIFSSYKK